jgi:hypothetical protein
MKMPEQNRALGGKVGALSQPVLHYRPDRDRMAGLELRLNNSPKNTQSISASQPTSRELILQLIEALKEL